MDQAKEVNDGVFSLLGIYYGVINKTGKQVTVELDFLIVSLCHSGPRSRLELSQTFAAVTTAFSHFVSV